MGRSAEAWQEQQDEGPTQEDYELMFYEYIIKEVASLKTEDESVDEFIARLRIDIVGVL